MNFKIEIPDESIKQALINKIDNLNKPKGSLGRLEELALQIGLIQQTLTPSLAHPCHLLFGGDHGIEREHVSASEIINRKIARGTANFRYEPAMTEAQFNQAIHTGAELVDRCAEEGCTIIGLGEMGIANTSPSSIWMSIFGKLLLKDCIGAGSGLNSEGIRHKLEVLQASLDNFQAQNHQPIDAIRYFGGFEMVGAIGAMLRAAERHMVILVDGFIMTACMLAASQLYPEILAYAVFGHCSNEGGHRDMLNLMNAEPLLSLDLRLGEGTGALCSYPIIESSIRMMNEMNNFDNAHITKYF